MSSLESEPRTIIDPLLLRAPGGKFDSFAIDGAAVASEMRILGMPDEAISETAIYASSTPAVINVPVHREGVARRDHHYFFASTGPHRREVYLYPSYAADILNGETYQPQEYDDTLGPLTEEEARLVAQDRQELEADREAERSRVGDFSSYLVRGLSNRAEHLIKIGKSIPRALGSIAITGASVLAAYLNHKYQVLPEVVGDVGSVAGAAASVFFSWRSAKVAIRRQQIENTVAYRWPADLRAKECAESYRQRRAAGKAPELVVYALQPKHQ